MSGPALIQTSSIGESPERCRHLSSEMLHWAGVTYWDYTVGEDTLNINADFLAALGYAPQDIFPFTLDRWQQFIHPDDSEVVSAFAKLIDGQADTMDIIYRMKTISGEWRYFRGRGGVAESDANKKVVRISGMLQDITDLKIANAMLQRQDVLLATVNDVASALLTATVKDFDQSISHVLHTLGTVTNVDRVYIWQNEMIDSELYCSQMYEWSPDAEPQQGNEYTVRIKYSDMIPTWKELFCAGKCVNNIVRNMLPAEQSQLAPQGIISILVAPIMLRDEFWGFIGFDDCQRERIWESTAEGILKSVGILLASAIQRNKTETALVQKQRTLDWILESSPIAVVISSEGKVDHLNKRSRELLAITKGTQLSDVHAKILGEWQGKTSRDTMFKEMVENGISSRDNIQFPCADGLVRDFKLTSLFLEPGDVHKSISWITDVTDLKEIERALIQARDKAEVATRAKSDFLARMSHEIRTPMNAILGMIYLCLQTELNEKQRDYLTKTQSAANNLLGIINDILDISKIESGKLELELIPFSLKKTIDEIVDIVRVGAEEKKLKLITTVDPEIGDHLIGDPLRLRQVLLNLINNAIKFTEQGGIFITVKQDPLFNGASNKNRLVFEIRDTGIGLQPEQIERIFDSFAQADGTITRKYGGTGLGLAIVKSFVELMEGEVKVTSTPGLGATFQFSIVVEQTAHGTSGSSIVLLDKRRILLIDDDANDLEILANLLQSMHLQVLPLHTGVAALEKLEEATARKAPFDVVMIDWRMPRMDGIETVRLIRQNKKIVPPYILMVSAYDRQECLRHVQGLNVSDVLAKPVHPDMLKEALKATFREDLTRKTNEVYADIRGAKVLLAEDNKINQMVASELLKLLHVELTIANNGIEAVEAVQKQDFDLILMDVQMPEMDGLTATQAIRRLDKPGVDKLPILAMTANALDTDYQRSLAAGMNDHLTKPIDPEKLRIALKKWIVRSDR